MLREHRVDVERAADVVGRIDGADLYVRLVACGEDRAHVLGRNREDPRTRNRVARDAAAEIAEVALRILCPLTKEIDVSDEFAAVAGTKRANVGDQPIAADDHLHLASDLA